MIAVLSGDECDEVMNALGIAAESMPFGSDQQKRCYAAAETMDRAIARAREAEYYTSEQTLGNCRN